MEQEQLERLIDAGLARVDAELAKEPFRAEPSWKDLRAVARGILGFIIAGPESLEPPATGEVLDSEAESASGEPSNVVQLASVVETATAAQAPAPAPAVVPSAPEPPVEPKPAA